MPKSLNLEGKKIGHLTFLRKTEEREHNYIVWECVCDCGNTTRISTRKIHRRKSLNCGCKSRAEDLTGMRFGHLVVQERAPNRRGRVCWLCRCDCGNMHTVTSELLKSGKAKSCGCLHSEKSRRSVDLRGRRFGRLIALYPTDKRNYKGSVIWHCRCDCGNETDVSEDSLVFGGYVSCGCRKKETQEKIGSTLTFMDGTCIEWLKNRKHRKDNTSGFRGVYRTIEGKYRTEIGFKGKRFYLGTYRSFSDAVEMRQTAERFVHDGYIEQFEKWKTENSAQNGDGTKTGLPLRFEVSRPERGILKITTDKEDRYLFYS